MVQDKPKADPIESGQRFGEFFPEVRTVCESPARRRL